MAQSPPRSPVHTAAPEDKFATVNGVRPHDLDWGGSGDALLFLTSLGGAAGDFQALAVHFTDNFHVLGLTRRGQGLSDKPETGYDTSTLVADIKAFLDVMAVKRVTLVGYSLAGNELTEFAGLHPQRVAGLVYLDAAYDLAENKELGKHLNLPPLRADNATQQLIDRSNEYHPDYSRIKAPALGVFVTYDAPPANAAFDAGTKKKTPDVVVRVWESIPAKTDREIPGRRRKGHSNGTTRHNSWRICLRGDSAEDFDPGDEEVSHQAAAQSRLLGRSNEFRRVWSGRVD